MSTLHEEAYQAQPLDETRLSPSARVAVMTDRSQGRTLRYREGMTLQDVVILTGLPRDEAERRLSALRRGDTGNRSPEIYAIAFLSVGAGERYREEQAKAKTQIPAPKSADVIHLHFWGEDYRAAPNAVFRSALFPSLRGNDKENRRYLENEEIFSVSGLKIFFTGKQFDQSDLDVYLELLHMAQPFPLGTPVKFSAHALLKALGLTTGGENHARLHQVLIRLRSGTVDITDHKKRYFGGLVESGMRDEITMNYMIRLNPDFAVLFGVDMWGKIDLETRRALGRNNTAKALQAYYSTHLNPGFHNIETLCNLLGLKGKNRKATLLKAHDALKAVSFCEGYEVRRDAIRPLNINQHPGQNRALVKQALKPARPSKPKSGPVPLLDALQPQGKGKK